VPETAAAQNVLKAEVEKATSKIKPGTSQAVAHISPGGKAKAKSTPRHTQVKISGILVRGGDSDFWKRGCIERDSSVRFRRLPEGTFSLCCESRRRALWC